MPTEEDLRDLDRKLKQLRLDYERYFLGSRPREPVLQRNEVNKLMVVYSNTAIQNTALRFKFNSLCSRFQALRRQWDDTLRKMEAGTYSRHRFKADLHERARRATPSGRADPPRRAEAEAPSDLFTQYREARAACGQAVASLTPEKLDGLLERQRSQLRERFGEQAEFRFRVVVEKGKAKLKASRVRA